MDLFRNRFIKSELVCYLVDTYILICKRNKIFVIICREFEFYLFIENRDDSQICGRNQHFEKLKYIYYSSSTLFSEIFVKKLSCTPLSIRSDICVSVFSVYEQESWVSLKVPCTIAYSRLQEKYLSCHNL